MEELHAQITRFSMGSCILGRKTFYYVQETRIIRISDQKASTPLIICMRAQPRIGVVNTHAKLLLQKWSYRRRYTMSETVPKHGMSAMIMVKTSTMPAPTHVPGIMVVTDIDLHGDAVEDL